MTLTSINHRWSHQQQVILMDIIMTEATNIKGRSHQQPSLTHRESKDDLVLCWHTTPYKKIATCLKLECIQMIWTGLPLSLRWIIRHFPNVGHSRLPRMHARSENQAYSPLQTSAEVRRARHRSTSDKHFLIKYNNVRSDATNNRPTTVDHIKLI